MEKRIVIIGAGPTGLGAGYRLKQLGYKNFHIYERNDYLGGLSASFTDEAGFTWDIGGHVMFSHYDYFDGVFHALMGDDFRWNNRESWVRLLGRWVPYPFQNNIRYLPPQQCYECLLGLIKARSNGGVVAAQNYAQFMEAMFGEGICRHFMRPYNFKVWAHPPETMGKSWIGERVAMIDVERALRNVLLKQDDFSWGPNNRFKFPLRGGTGEFYRRFAAPLAGHITTGRGVSSADLRRRRLRLDDDSVEDYDWLISTMPLDVFCRSAAEGLPGDVLAAASRLRHSSGHMVGVGIRQCGPSTRSWMYFPEDNCPFYRVTYLSNYSPHMTPDDNHYSLLCETSYSSHRAVDGATIVQDTVAGLVNAGLLSDRDTADIVSTWHFEAPYSYPTPTVGRDQALATVTPYLERQNVLTRGRFGMWRYEISNTDHSLMQGVEAADRLLLNKPEQTIGNNRPTQTLQAQPTSSPVRQARSA